MRHLIALLASVIAIVVGLITLLGLLVGDDLGFLSALVDAFRVRSLADVLLQLVMITVGVTILIGILNLLAVHLGRVVGRRRGWVYSLILVLSTLGVFGLTIAERARLVQTSPDSPAPSMVLFETVQVAVESSLAALVLFALVYGGYRLMRRGVTWKGMLFTAVLLVVLLGALPLQGEGLSLIGQVSRWLMAVPVSAGARGILLGIALATVITGVRVLTGQDRSYRE